MISRGHGPFSEACSLLHRFCSDLHPRNIIRRGPSTPPVLQHALSRPAKAQPWQRDAALCWCCSQVLSYLEEVRAVPQSAIETFILGGRPSFASGEVEYACGALVPPLGIAEDTVHHVHLMDGSSQSQPVAATPASQPQSQAMTAKDCGPTTVYAPHLPRTMVLDSSTVAHLQLIDVEDGEASAKQLESTGLERVQRIGKAPKGTLLALVDRCNTAMGRRMLRRKWFGPSHGTATASLPF